MDEKDDFLQEPLFFEKIQMTTNTLVHIISQEMGCRIGESTVCSQKMHTFHVQRPEEVNILQDIDAGQTFYHRKDPGSIYHLDVFHECGLVDHHNVAAEIHKTVEVYNRHYSIAKKIVADEYVKVDFIDIQTGTGGGRITGSLDYGKKVSLRKGHINHVHITMMLPKEQLTCIIYIIMAVENVILSSNLELRRNEKVENVKGTSKGNIDLSAYTDQSDSLLQENNSIEMFKSNQNSQEITQNIDTAQELKEFLEPSVKNDGPKPKGGINSRRRVERSVEKGMIELNNDRKNFINSGGFCKSYLTKHLPEIQLHLRQVVRAAKNLFTQTGKSKILQNKISCCGGGKILHHAKIGHTVGEVAISQTVTAAARSMVEKKQNVFQITHEDLRYSVNRKRRKIEICLLIDASSSMEGQRIRAAKLLAKFLFLSTADRTSVIVFQENKAWVQVPFTRDLTQLEQRLEEIKAYGETPLALGLTACLQYLDKMKSRNPLIILITDGVPTLGMVTSDPVHDALQVAKLIKTKKYGFTCIGLKPHLDYLKQLSNITGGSIYAVDKLEEAGMC